ncbi:MAG: sugar phosphate isomerase/epimerase [Clostridia bacterium]|nr:sugar phosphate isomerase/epimerase [Clostridia bacterium]
MKLSIAPIALNHYFDTDQEQRTILEFFRDCGYTCVDYEIRMPYIQDDEQLHAKRLRETLAELGMTAPQAHAPIVDPFDPESDHLTVFRRSLEFCKIVGIPWVVIHAGEVKGATKEEFQAANREFYRSLIPYMEETGVGVLLENIGHYEQDYYLKNGAELRELIDVLDHPMFGACWDVGHANLNWKKDCEQYSSVVALGDKLKALHVHSNAGYFEKSHRHHRIDMHGLPYMSLYDSVNYDALIQGLIDIGYEGTFNFEVNVPVKTVRYSFEYKGEIVRKLEKLPLDLAKQYNVLLYNIGKYMLETYGIFEG